MVFSLAAASSPYVLLLLAAAWLTGWLAYRAWHRRSRPGALPFAAMMATATVWTLTYATSLTVFTLEVRRAFEPVTWFTGTMLSVWWFVFALEYTGHDDGLSRRSVVVLSAVPLATTLAIATNRAHGMVWSNYHIVAGVPIATVEYTPESLFWIGVGYAYLLLALGIALLFRELWYAESLYADQTVALVVASLLPWVGNILWIAGLTPVEGLDTTQYAFALAGLLLGHALFRHDLLSVVPATRETGEQAVVRDLDSAVVVLDTEGTVQWLNPAAAETFGIEPGTVVGDSVESVVGRPLDLDADEVTVELETTDGRRTYQVRNSGLSNAGGAVGLPDGGTETSGRALVLTDVTDQQLRRQRLQVLNRVLRHNFRNDMNVVRLVAERIARHGDEQSAAFADDILETTDDLMTLATRVQQAERVMERTTDEHERTAIGALLERIVEDVRDQYPDATIRIADVSRATVETDVGTLDLVVSNVVENAAAHAGDDPTVEVSATIEDRWLTVRVVDDGPGVPDQEIESVTSGRETDLLHSSGMGLWLVQWGVTRLGGDLEFGERTNGGAVVTVHVPAVAE